MQFLDAAQAGIVLEVGADKIRLPLFTLGDYADWCAELDAERRKERAEALALLPPEKRFQAAMAYRLIRADIGDAASLVFTPDGMRRVVSACFGRAVVVARDGKPVEPPEPLAPDRAKAIQDANTDQMLILARRLAAVREEAAKPPADQKADDKKGDKGVPDPLPPGGSTP